MKRGLFVFVIRTSEKRGALKPHTSYFSSLAEHLLDDRLTNLSE